MRCTSVVPMLATSPASTCFGKSAPRRTAWRVTSCCTRTAAVKKFVTALRWRSTPATAWTTPNPSTTMDQAMSPPLWRSTTAFTAPPIAAGISP